MDFPEVALLWICRYLDLNDVFNKVAVLSKRYNTFTKLHLRSILLAINEECFTEISHRLAKFGILAWILDTCGSVIRQLMLSQLSKNAYWMILHKCSNLEIFSWEKPYLENTEVQIECNATDRTHTKNKILELNITSNLFSDDDLAATICCSCQFLSQFQLGTSPGQPLGISSKNLPGGLGFDF